MPIPESLLSSRVASGVQYPGGRDIHSSGDTMRKFIRHPSDIPLDFQLEQPVAAGHDYLMNVSHGGLAFHSRTPLPVGHNITVSIPLIDPAFHTPARITWCRPDFQAFEIGVEFLSEEDAFRMRMVEQICHIEHYKQAIQNAEGRQLSGEQAAIEWILKFAGNFPEPQ